MFARLWIVTCGTRYICLGRFIPLGYLVNRSTNSTIQLSTAHAQCTLGCVVIKFFQSFLLHLYVFKKGKISKKKRKFSVLPTFFAPEDPQESIISQNIFIFKIPFVINPIIHCWENVQKLAENCNIEFWQIFGSYWAFSQLRIIGSISSLLLLVSYLETQV